ncbi:MAG: hypothetical protein ACRED5_07220 [Propylenella sp.]
MQQQSKQQAVTGGEATHTVRRSIFAKERTYRLEPDAVAWTEGKSSGRVRYADVKGIHIYSMPPAMGQTVRRTVLRGNFRRKLKIQATHFLGFGRTEDRAESYFRFMEQLLARITAANPQVAIHAGQGWPLYIFWLVIFLASIVILALGAIMFAVGAFEAKALPAFAIVLLFLPVSWRIIRRGRPRRADAGALHRADLGG